MINLSSLKDANKWKRLLFMVLFMVINYYFMPFLMVLIPIGQFLVFLFTGRKNVPLILLGQGLSRYVYNILLFLTYNSEERPFPFTSWPGSGTPGDGGGGHFRSGRSRLKKVN